MSGIKIDAIESTPLVRRLLNPCVVFVLATADDSSVDF